MASTPAFTATPRIGFGEVSVANTNRDGTGTIVDVITGVATGTKINEVVIKATGDPADSIVTLFLYNGTSYELFDEIDIGNPSAGATTSTAYRTTVTYTNLILPSASWKLAAAVTVVPTSGVINVFALAGDF
jgi:hypothetical protein